MFLENPTLKRNTFVLFIGFIAVLALFLLTYIYQTERNTLFIKEVSFSNNDKQDWVTLYNPSMNSLSLKGYYLSDDLDDPLKFQIPYDVIIPAQGVAKLHGKKSDQLAMDAIRLNFSLSNGETLVLTSPSGKDQIDRITLVAPLDYKGEFTIGRETSTPHIIDIFYANATSVVANAQ
jgi:hypothetical protein